ncbi:MAG: MerR family DNA-binding protein [Saccharospirillaceae bacterium]|nr:MerR family DNA-binding protein [Pseudomonadales bacterium]NRB78536.1 MerR family DNA-binding protein [Saccharospirillaceae bacterium]
MFIKQAKDLGISLNDISKINLNDTTQLDWQDVFNQLETISKSKLEEIQKLQSQIQNIKNMQAGIKQCITD